MKLIIEERLREKHPTAQYAVFCGVCRRHIITFDTDKPNLAEIFTEMDGHICEGWSQ